MTTNTIRTIVFDLGRVLVDFSLEPFAALLKEHGAEFSSLKEFANHINMSAYERGELSSEEFIIGVQKFLPKQISVETLQKRWLDIFAPCKDMLNLAKDLSETYTVAILSNTSELHWEHLIPTYNLDKITNHLIASFQVGALKPDPAIYRATEQLTSSQPESMVFIDDIIENVSGAIHCGWQGIHHRSFSETCAALQEIGVRMPKG